MYEYWVVGSSKLANGFGVGYSVHKSEALAKAKISWYWQRNNPTLGFEVHRVRLA
jgi:hypothetical protein